MDARKKSDNLIFPLSRFPKQTAAFLLAKFFGKISSGQVKGIILAGGTGSRLYPLTLDASKQLQSVYDKPLVYYLLTTLIEGGVRDLCLISTPHDLPRFQQLLGDGPRFGVTIEYRGIKEKPSLPKNNYAVPGHYICDNQVVDIAKNLQPSARGKIEITSINMEYLRRKPLHVQRLARGFAVA